jgi:dTDP-4-dehydrorhamnose reductase
MNILIIGASGLVGSYCFDFFSKLKSYKIIGTHVTQAYKDTQYFNPLESNIDLFLNHIKFSPDLIIHCAALTNVEYCEENEVESFENNVLITQKVVSFCLDKKIKLVYFSTDYIFDGINGPYKEDDIPCPINIYGKHKLEAEQKVQLLNEYLILRVTNVYGNELRNKNFIARLISNIRNNVVQSIELPFDQLATPIYAKDIAIMTSLLIENQKNGIYNLASTDYINRYQLAIKVLNYFPDNKLTIRPISSEILSQKAARPLKGGLLNYKFIIQFPDFCFTNVDSFIQNQLNNGIKKH